MRKALPYILAVYFLGLAVYMFAWPMAWYEATPGVAMMGPFNLHFVRDVALVFLMSGGAMFWGVRKHDATAIICGAAWPCLHAVFHLYIWGARGFPFDIIAATNFSAIQLPAWLALWVGVKAALARKA